MKVLSLFDGISCARVALERVGIPIEEYWSSEIDKYAIAISDKNYPDIIRCGDVTELKWRKNQKFDFDLLIGGSPCQDLSIAKKNRKGLDGERSGLFWDYVRILKETKPKYFILENVASMAKDQQEIISKTLGVQPIMINAALLSAQNRKRLFWTNIPGVCEPKDKGIYLKDILENKEVPFTKYGLEKMKSNTVRTSGRSSGIDDKHNWDTIRVGQLGKGGQGDRVYSPEGKSVALSANGGGRGAKTGLYIIQTKRGNNKGGKRALNGKTPTLTSSKWEHNNHLYKNGYIRKLTAVECERLQSLPDEYTSGISDAQRYKVLGNAFNVDVVAHILSFIPKK